MPSCLAFTLCWQSPEYSCICYRVRSGLTSSKGDPLGQKGKQVLFLSLMESAPLFSLLIQFWLRLLILSVNFPIGNKYVGLWFVVSGLVLKCLCLEKHLHLFFSFNLWPHLCTSCLPLGHSGLQSFKRTSFEADWYLKYWQHYRTVKCWDSSTQVWAELLNIQVQAGLKQSCSGALKTFLQRLHTV